jgi:lysozyme family protein
MQYRPLLVFIVAALPTAATLVYEWTTGITPANWVRAAAGLAIGGAGAWLVARGLAASPEVN